MHLRFLFFFLSCQIAATDFKSVAEWMFSCLFDYCSKDKWQQNVNIFIIFIFSLKFGVLSVLLWLCIFAAVVSFVGLFKKASQVHRVDLTRTIVYIYASRQWQQYNLLHHLCKTSVTGYASYWQIHRNVCWAANVHTSFGFQGDKLWGSKTVVSKLIRCHSFIMMSSSLWMDIKQSVSSEVGCILCVGRMQSKHDISQPCNKGLSFRDSKQDHDHGKCNKLTVQVTTPLTVVDPVVYYFLDLSSWHQLKAVFVFISCLLNRTETYAENLSQIIVQVSLTLLEMYRLPDEWSCSKRCNDSCDSALFVHPLNQPSWWVDIFLETVFHIWI